MSDSRVSINRADLWATDPSDFNEWRAENDIPALFKYLYTILPFFSEWIKSLSVDERILHRAINIGQIFQGGEKYLLQQSTTGKRDKIWCVDIYDIDNSRWQDNISEHTDWSFRIVHSKLCKFTPYFPWVKNRTGNDNPVRPNKNNNEWVNDFRITLRRGAPPNSQAYLFMEFPLLKMGNITLPPGTFIGHRNLDFLDLDNLHIPKDVNSSAPVCITYSSMQNLSITNIHLAYYDFFNCDFLDTHITNKATIQDFRFFDCSVNSLYIDSATIWNLDFSNCDVLPYITDCNLKNKIQYTPPLRQRDRGESTFRMLRTAYQARGKQKEASEYFYSEQVSHQKNLYSPYWVPDYRGKLPPPPQKSKNLTPISGFLNHAKNRFKWYLKIFKKQETASFYLKLKAKWAISLVDNGLWGYGEKPQRIFICSAGIIALYSTFYYINLENLSYGDQTVTISFLDCLYLSAVTFTTLGYGDILPKSDITKLLCGSEAVIGAFMIGLVVAGFSNRSRY